MKYNTAGETNALKLVDVLLRGNTPQGRFPAQAGDGLYGFIVAHASSADVADIIRYAEKGILSKTIPYFGRSRELKFARALRQMPEETAQAMLDTIAATAYALPDETKKSK